MLTKAQRKALQDLSEPGSYTVGWRYESCGLSWKGYRDLREQKLIAEAWTWASTTRPDVGITEAGVAARAERQ